MERLKSMKERLMQCAESQIYGDLGSVDTKELGEVVDMIKDFEEAMYYCSIVKVMEENEKEGKHHREQAYYPYYMMPERDIDRMGGRMYYPDRRNINYNYPIEYNDSKYYPNGNRQSIGENRNYPMEIRDYREGRSSISRRTYMESKELHKDNKVKMQELDKYVQELSHDIVEMIEGASPEEKQLLQQKLSLLASKIK